MDRWPNLLLLVGAASVLTASNWNVGLDADEQVQFTALLGKPLIEGASAPWNLYDFGHVRDDPNTEVARKAELVYRGDVKWCESPQPFKVFFFRPLSSAFLWLQFQAFSLHLRAYHVLQVFLLLAACALAVALFNRVLVGVGVRPLPLPAVAAMLALNPLNQELVARICAVHYLVAAICGFGAYVVLTASSTKPLLRSALVLLLGAASLLAGEAAFQVHAIASCAMLAHLRAMRRDQRIAWALLMLQVAVYVAWYTQTSFDAAGYGYTGFGGASGDGARRQKVIDAALDLFSGTLLSQVRGWYGVLRLAGSKSVAAAVVHSLAFVTLVGVYLGAGGRPRSLAGALLAAAAISALPVAAVAQPGMRVIALPSLPLQFLICMMLRDAWHERPRREPALRTVALPRTSGALAAVFVLAYVGLRLGSDVVLTPVAIREIRLRTRVVAARWLPKPASRSGDAVADNARQDADDDANVLVVSGTTGAPQPFGADLLARNGFAPMLDRWLFLTDLPKGFVQLERDAPNSFKVSLTPLAMAYDAKYFNLYTLAQRCSAVKWATHHTRMADLFVRETTYDGNPVEVELVFRPGVAPKFWSLLDGRIVPAQPPALGETKVY